MHLIFEPPLNDPMWKIYGDYNSIQEKLNLNKLSPILQNLFKGGETDTCTISPVKPGFSEAMVLLANYVRQGKMRSSVLKLSNDLAKEANAFNQFGSLLKKNRVEFEQTYGAIAYSYISGAVELRDYLNNNQNLIPDRSAEEILGVLFNNLNPWYVELKENGKRFFDRHHPPFDQIQSILESHSAERIRDRWEALSRRKQVDFIFDTICHGDLNLRNVLIDSSERNPTPFVIDFADSGYDTCSVDFVRLEREIRFNLFPNPVVSEAIVSIADSSFLDFDPDAIPLRSHEKETQRALKLIKLIRSQFFHIFDFRIKDRHAPEKLYFHTLAFDQLKLLKYSPWDQAHQRTMEKLIIKSVTTLLDHLMRTPKTRFAFGTIAEREIDGTEKVILQKVGHEQYKFPVQLVVASEEYLISAVEDKFKEAFLEKFVISKDEFFNSGFTKFEFTRLHPEHGKDFLWSDGGKEYSVDPILCKIYVNKPLKLRNNSFVAKDLNDLIVYRREEETWDLVPENKGLENYLFDWITSDKITREFGYCVLECVDVLVVRSFLKDDEQVLLLERNKQGETYSGWEYPKGGMKFHENPREAGKRELEEEVCPKENVKIKFLGYLGHQTVDVRNRFHPNYQFLRVHGCVFEFDGGKKDVDPRRRKTESHDGYEWMSLDQAKESVKDNVGISSYAIEFFKRYELARERARETGYLNYYQAFNNSITI